MEATATTPLPMVVLRDLTISPSVLQYIPLEMMKKYQISAFEQTDTVLKLAIVHPEQLKQGFMTAVQDLGKKVGRSVELYKTDLGSLQEAIKQAEKIRSEPSTAKKIVTAPLPELIPAPVSAAAKAPIAPAPSPVPQPVQASQPAQTPQLPVAPKPVRASEPLPPPLFRVGKTVAVAYLKRVPLEYAKAHRIACVDFQAPNTFWFATDGSNENDINRVIPLIEKENNIHIQKLVLKKQDLTDLLGFYENLLKDEAAKKNGAHADEVAVQEATIIPQAPKSTTARPDIPLPPPKPLQATPIAQKPPLQATDLAENEKLGMTVLDEQAAITVTQDEKTGIAGFLQRMNISLTGQKPEDHEAIVAEEPVKLPKMEAPSTGVSSRSVAEPAQLVQPGPNVPTSTTPVAAPAPTPPAPGVIPVAAVSTAKTDDESGDIGKLLDHQVSSLDELREIIKKGFIPRIVAAVVSYAIFEKSSDVHIESFADEVRVRYRIDGQLLDIVKLPADVHAAMVSRIKILSRLRLDETRIPQDGRFDVNFNNAQVDLRVSLMPTVHGEKVVMRILDKSKGIASLEKLGIEGLGYENLTKAIQKPFGIALATGPTGSGKSTSLYAILNRIATPNVNVVTLEDPVEYEMKGINQAQIRPKIGFTFAEGLRSILRQDPNIIMVGEIRDGETANMATQAALTGHLVLSTLHTNDAAGAIPRLTNMGIEPFLIASSLNVAMGQRLVRKICPNCKKEISLPSGFKSQIEKDIAIIEALNPVDIKRIPKPFAFYQGMGCTVCGGKGYTGRVGIYEVLVMSEEVEDLTLNHASNEQIQAQAQKEGMLTMYQDGLLKVINGITTLDEVLRETSTR